MCEYAGNSVQLCCDTHDRLLLLRYGWWRAILGVFNITFAYKLHSDTSIVEEVPHDHADRSVHR